MLLDLLWNTLLILLENCGISGFLMFDIMAVPSVSLASTRNMAKIIGIITDNFDLILVCLASNCRNCEGYPHEFCHFSIHHCLKVICLEELWGLTIRCSIIIFQSFRRLYCAFNFIIVHEENVKLQPAFILPQGNLYLPVCWNKIPHMLWNLQIFY